MHMWPPCSSNWPLGILPVPCTGGPFPAAPAGLCTTHAHFHHLPASPGHHSSKNRQQLQEVVLTFHVLEGFIWHCWKKNQQTRLSLAHFHISLWSRQQEKVSLHFPASEWGAFVCFGMAIDWCMLWESRVEHKLAETSMGLSPVSSPGVVSSCHPQWQHLMHGEG